MIKTSAALLSLTCLLGCGSDPPAPDQAPPSGGGGNAGGTGGYETGGTVGFGGFAGNVAGGGGSETGGSGGSGGTALPGCQMSATDAEQPMLLSETHCVDMIDPTKPAPGLIAYDVTSPLWSDGAVKERFISIPAGTTIHVKNCTTEPDTCAPDTGTDEDEGHWDMPVGTVLVKNFTVGGQRIETRLLMQRNATTWKGFSYEWNDEGTEATRLTGELDKDLGTQVWHYPSSSQCLECHTKGAGRSLGPTTAQMNRDFVYAEGTMNQIAKFEALGLFDAAPTMITGYPDPYGTAPLEERVRSYFQTNCSICHRPGGTLSDIDFRFTTAYADMDLECSPIIRGTGDVMLPQVRLVPGSPEESSLSFRMHDLTTYRMPRIGSSVVDMDAVQMVDEWITAMPAPAPDTCPPP